MTNDEIESIAIHAEAACKCSFDDVDPVFAIRELQSRVEDLQDEGDAAVSHLGKAVGALEDIAEGEPDPDTLAENIWCKDRAAECLATIRARSNKGPGQ